MAPAAAFGRLTRIITLAMFSAAVSHGIVTDSHAATVTPVGPFIGDYHEDYNRFTTNHALATLRTFDEHATMIRLDPAGSIKIEWSSQLGSDLVVPRSGMMSGMLSPLDWTFDQPITRFGGWWENNSHANDATVQFFDSAGNALGTTVANVSHTAQVWQWNAWELDQPFSRMRITGNGLINGFIWFEDMEMTLAVPEPAAMSVLAILAPILISRRRRNVASLV